MRVIAALLLLTSVPRLFGQDPGQALKATVLRAITTTSVIDNRSLLRSNEVHSICATGTGTWSVQLQHSTASTGPWVNFSDPAAIVSNLSPSCMGAGHGLYPYVRLLVTGTASVDYSGVSGIFLPEAQITGAGTVTSISGSGPSWLNWVITNPNTIPAITLTPATGQTSHQVLGTCGTATVFGPCALVATDIPPIPLATGVSGNLAVSHLNGGTGASSTTAWFGDGTWKSASGGGSIWLSAKTDCGMVMDGVANDSAALSGCITNAYNAGASAVTIQFPTGVAGICNLTIDNNAGARKNLNFLGGGEGSFGIGANWATLGGSTVFRYLTSGPNACSSAVGTGNYVLRILGSGGVGFTGVHMSGIDIDSANVSSPAGADHTLWLTNVYGGSFTNLTLERHQYTGLIVDGNIPNPPVVTPTCSGTCATTYGYVVSANIPGPTTTASGSAGTAVQAATLDGSHFNSVVTPTVSGSTGCNVYRSTGGSTQGKITSVPVACGSTVTDNGIVADGSPSPVIQFLCGSGSGFNNFDNLNIYTFGGRSTGIRLGNSTNDVCSNKFGKYNIQYGGVLLDGTSYPGIDVTQADSNSFDQGSVLALSGNAVTIITVSTNVAAITLAGSTGMTVGARAGIFMGHVNDCVSTPIIGLQGNFIATAVDGTHLTIPTVGVANGTYCATGLAASGLFIRNNSNNAGNSFNRLQVDNGVTSDSPGINSINNLVYETDTAATFKSANVGNLNITGMAGYVAQSLGTDNVPHAIIRTLYDGVGGSALNWTPGTSWIEISPNSGIVPMVNQTGAIGNLTTYFGGVYSLQYYGAIQTPTQGATACNLGLVLWDTQFVYECVDTATSTWRRIAWESFTSGGSPGSFPFASLPACNAAMEGAKNHVSDSNTNTWGATVAGGGANRVGVYCNGSNWTISSK